MLMFKFPNSFEFAKAYGSLLKTMTTTHLDITRPVTQFILFSFPLC